ncbi:MAG: hypothetical protein Kow0059_11300 [Candidatus Sumerlaeia bacterium]
MTRTGRPVSPVPGGGLLWALAAGGLWALTIYGHLVILRMPFHEEQLRPLLMRLAAGAAVMLAVGAAVRGPRAWRTAAAPVARTHPVRAALFALLVTASMIVPARKGNLAGDWPMMVLLFTKLGAGLWFVLELTAWWSGRCASAGWGEDRDAAGFDPCADGPGRGAMAQWIQGRAAPWLCGAIAGTLALAANLHLWEGVIRIPDEASYWIQGAMLAQGRLWLPAHPWTQSFISEFNVVDGGKWFGAYPPGWPVLLAVGCLAGVPQIVNPLLTALIAGLMLALVRRQFAPRLATPAFVIIAFSPWLWEEGMTFLSHSTALAAFVIGLTFLHKWLRRPGPWPALGAGLALGWIGLTRQLDAACVFGALGVWVLLVLRGVAWSRRLELLGALALGGALFGGLHLAYNAALTGDPLYFPLKRYYDLLRGEQWFRYGFGPDIGDLSGYCWALGHSPIEGVWNAWVNITVINGDFLGWPGGSLIVFWLWLVLARKDAFERLLLLVAAALFAAYFFWWYHGLLTGSRYYFLLWPAAVWGTLRGLERLAELWRERVSAGGGAAGAAPAGEAAVRSGVRFAVASTVLALLCYYPLLVFEYYPGFFGIEREPWTRLAADLERPALVFVRGEGFNRFAVPYCLNRVPPGGEVVWARDLGDSANRLVIEQFPNRRVYLVEDFRLVTYERTVDHP